MKLDNKQIFATLNPNKVWFPILIGLGIVFLMFYLDPNINAQTLKGVFDGSIWWILLAVVVILFRDLGYIYRIRAVTDQQLTWGRALYVIILWEFASAVTPSVVGGSAVAIFILNKEVDTTLFTGFGKDLGAGFAVVLLDCCPSATNGIKNASIIVR